MTTNQPTDVTQDLGPVITPDNALHYALDLADATVDQIRSLTAQLAALQAEAKAWEAWGEKLEKQLEPFANQKNWGGGSKFELNPDGDEIITTGFFHTYEGYKPWYNARRVLLSKPQPVDASSLARIARCAQFPDALFYQNLNNPQAARRLVNHWLDNYNALTPNDIALAQALAGGAP